MIQRVACDQGNEVKIVRGALDQAKQQQAATTDRHDFDLVAAVSEKLTNGGKCFAKGTLVQHL